MLFSPIPSPIGTLLAASTEPGVLDVLHLPNGRTSAPVQAGWERDDAAFAETRGQLAEYFAGTRTAFDLPLRLRGSSFQLRVWAALTEIPYGETTSYGAIARGLGRPDAARAVGLANGQNPIPIIVACHRVIGADGSLTGYGGGLPAKQWLLAHEASHSGLFAAQSL